MEVRKGYKQTEVGIIPKDWNVYFLGEIGKFKNGINKGSEAFGQGTPFVNLMDVFGVNSIASTENLGLITCTNFEQSTYNLKRGDVIFIRSSVKPSGVGLTAVVENDLPATVYSGFLIRFRDGGTLDIGYKRFCFYEERFRNSIIGSSTVSANTNINQESLKRLCIPLPPTLAEQEAITEALSDADALIEAVEQLLAKKRQVKQGAMSELLTGKRRLSGFSGEWETKKLGEITEIVSGGTPSTRMAEYWNGNINWCTPTDITGTSGKYLDSTEKQITELGLKNSSANLLPKGTLLLCTRATIGEVKIATDVICTNQGFKSLICSNQVNNEFLYYVLLTLKPKLIEKAIGSTFLEITKKETALIEIRIPSIAEQTAIAEILSDMDAEITALEEKLVKARQVKAGMMSVLLTGRVRLV